MTQPSEDRPVDTSIDPDIRPPDREALAALEESGETENRRIVGELIEVAEEAPAEPEITLTHEERQDFERLLTVGRRYKTINVADHDIRIRTLKTADEMRIGLYTKPYLESHAFARAHQVAVIASGLVEIRKNGVEQELWTSLKEVTDPDEIFAKNVDALKEFHPPVIAKIYEEIMNLEREFAQLAVKLGKLLG
ncbi:tail assembly chaperone [Mycobacterium phage Myrna]|uniref:Tail assembly chaperone n=1 Tax=Mycobacterium phage Myrna TaxID=546805 RepID=B5LJD1_9CAUD|nr:tail assembly chaperone [Mycobacterium phage Myrna]ACH62127.1 tail assembly chaperone [Mycobacterium phage Myrna]